MYTNDCLHPFFIHTHAHNFNADSIFSHLLICVCFFFYSLTQRNLTLSQIKSALEVQIITVYVYENDQQKLFNLKYSNFDILNATVVTRLHTHTNWIFIIYQCNRFYGSVQNKTKQKKSNNYGQSNVLDLLNKCFFLISLSTLTFRDTMQIIIASIYFTQS